MNGLSLTKKSHFSSCPAALLCILPSAAILSMTFSLRLLHLHLSNLHVLRFPPFSSSHHPCYMSLLSLSDEYYNNSTLTYLSQRQSALLLVITVPPCLPLSQHLYTSASRYPCCTSIVHLPHLSPPPPF
ncbi:hypothetical protein BS50DRAFT_147740 [Corynespora cassiicola Philippines]|uniref:Uncharacterized protein n=1 Tax=Corynespora cassiicola Philippines TaxID=1448308 RepID=A0A2T2N924_CORCC|nr:hypothetical protein BS50DRAFT_147740 [Corynespora cassiicola Philippines]